MSSYPWLTGFLGDPRDTVAPRRGSNKDGRLPPLLVALTVVTGLVDAVSYLVLGHVFVANMTGNVVFFAFALADVGGFSATASVAAIGCFALGALAGALLVLHVHIVYPLEIARLSWPRWPSRPSRGPGTPAPLHRRTRCALLPCRPTR